MNVRIAAAIFVLLILSVAVGVSALAATPNYPAPKNAVYVHTSESAAPDPDARSCALIIALLIGGAATVGFVFFAPQTPKGSRSGGTLSAVVTAPTWRRYSLVERARRGLAHLHQELDIVLGLLQTVDQQIDRLVRVQAGQYAAQLVQHPRLVGAEQ